MTFAHFMQGVELNEPEDQIARIAGSISAKYLVIQTQYLDIRKYLRREWECKHNFG